jgi:hypothetical protein
MAGTLTNGFDMAIEVSAQSIQNLLSATFDSDGFVGKLFQNIPGVNLVLEGFDLVVNFTRPSGLPASATNPVQLLFNLRFVGGLTGTLDVVAGLNVDRTDPGTDKVVVDMVNRLFRCDVNLAGITIPGISGVNGLIGQRLKNQTVPLIPVPVSRATTSNAQIRQADVKVIDGTGNDDALLVTLTFGGGTAGNLNAFAQPFARQGAGAAVAIAFPWICRNVGPKIEEGIGLPAGSFANCGFRGDHELGEGVRLTSLNFSAADDHLLLRGTVAKSGFCYSATGNFSAKILVAIEAGQLKVRFEASDPDIDVDIPWYCYVAGAVIGAVIGGIIFGLIGAIVGSILVPLLIWVAQDVVENTIEDVTADVTDTINDAANLDVQLVGVETVLDSAVIDDLTVGYDLHVNEYWPIKAEGAATLGPGQGIDLDTGLVKTGDFSGADLRLVGSGSGRYLQVLCGSSAAELGSPVFGRVRRYHLLMLSYGLVTQIPMHAVAYYFPMPFTDDDYRETNRVFAIQTSDGSYGFFQVVEVTDKRYVLRYKVYKSALYTLEVVGGFGYRAPRFGVVDKHLRLEGIAYEPAKVANLKFRELLATQAVYRQDKAQTVASQEVMSNALAPVRMVPLPASYTLLDRKVLAYNKGVGSWLGSYAAAPDKQTAQFVARVTGNLGVKQCIWSVNNQALADKTTGQVTLAGHTFAFTTAGTTLTLSSSAKATVELSVKATVVFDNALVDSAIKCTRYHATYKVTKRVLPKFADFSEKFAEEHGTARLPAGLKLATG